jgi:uncharacterized coiled-coil DUF342 family protein
LVPSKRDTPTSDAHLDQLDTLKQSNESLRGRVNELEFVNDLIKSRVAELESSEHKTRLTVDTLKSELLESQARENELYRKMEKLRDQLADATSNRHSRSPSSSSRDEMDDPAAKRRKVSLSEIVEKGQSEKVNSVEDNMEKFV